VLEPNIIHQDAAGASATELVTNIFEICNTETTGAGCSYSYMGLS
jgi:hypothetical protein